MDIASAKHISEADMAETLFEPIKTENLNLREKLIKYKAACDKLEEDLATAKEAATFANLGGMSAINGIGSGLSSFTSSLGLSN